MAKPPHTGSDMGVFYLICWRRNYPQATGTRPVVGGFLSAIQAGTIAVAPYGIGALGVLALIAYGTRQWPLVMSSGAGLGDALAGFLLLVLGLGITLWMLTKIIPM